MSVKFALWQPVAMAFCVSAALASPGLAQTAEPAAPASVLTAPAAAPSTGPSTLGVAVKPITVTAAKPDPADPDAMVCKREPDTGSRVKATKICMTRRQWSENGRDASKFIADMASAKNGSN